MCPYFYQYRLKQKALTLTILITIIIAGIECASGASLEEQWNKTYGRSEQDWAEVVQQTSDSGYIIAGRTGLCQPCPDVWVIKTDSKGNEQWNKTFGKTGDYYISFLQQTSDDGYILSGKTESWFHGVEKSSFWLIKTDSKGNEQWNKTCGDGVIKWGRFVHQTSDGGYFIAITTSSCDDKCPENIRLVKLNSKGEEQWNMTYGGAGYEWIDYIYQMNDGSYIIGCDVFPMFALIKINPRGEIQWIKNYEDVDSFQQTSDGGFILAGDKNSDFLMIKLGKDEPVPNASFSYNPGYPGVEQIDRFDTTPSFDPSGDTRSEEIPKGPPNMPGFSSLLVGSSLLVWIYFVYIRQRLVK